MIQLTNDQIEDLLQEVITDPIHDCSVFGPWFTGQVNNRGWDTQIQFELEVRRRCALVNLALRRYCKP
jgi:hypothetical protein